ncbi:hypothetical protein MCAP1_003468 [Malassezia caprae]|uniref:Uncharacterized protein n=1 Tax=Malassezia caprae TaxID=1381934 RepID=A0AAF0E7G9_9BASI|nr:hypothetical protein MCAP1_003468 [Malassezia caprae]
MAAALARSERAASPDFLTPLDMTGIGFGRRSTWSHEAREPGSDGDDEQIMQHLRAARERLLSFSDEAMCAVDEAIDSPPVLNSPPIPRERAQSQPSSAQPAAFGRGHGSRPAHRSLTLDLTSVPFSSFIDAERRRLNEGLGTPGSYEAPFTITAPSHDLSGSRFGLAPYMNLERDEWLWTTEGPSPCDTGSEDGRYSPTAHEVSRRASQAEEAWTWAMSGPPAEHCEGTS